jgi:two-component system sensor histidine kinase KdpD
MNDSRPDPDQILKVVEQDRRAKHRGQLKIFFGSAAGVGKTYMMLEAAHAAERDGTDVVIGIIETHKRPETEKLAGDLPALPRKKFVHKGVVLEEFDLDAALSRKPSVLLLDEMAHTNAPGSRHPKRWQDIEELIDSGITVYTTLNVQHLESLNDVVTGITGIDVQETVPDELFDDADDIKLVDLPTEELLERLKQGKVYIAEGAAERAKQNFFTSTNLMSLRELALRRMAEYVDGDTDEERIREGLFTPNIAGDKILVCVGADMLAAKLVRSARRTAAGLKAPWYVLAIDTTETSTNPRVLRHRNHALRIAEQNGARVLTLQADRLGPTIIDFARSKGITKIIIGRTLRPLWLDWFRNSLAEYVIRHSGAIDVYVITGSSSKGNTSLSMASQTTRTDYALAFTLTSFFTAIGVLTQPFLHPIDQALLYLIAVVLAVAKLGRIPALLTAFTSVACFNFFFVEPLYSFDVTNSSYWITFAIMLIASWVISHQAGKLRQQTIVARERERKTQTFYALSKELAATRGEENVIEVTIKHLREALRGEFLVWIADENGVLCPFVKDEDERAKTQTDDLVKEQLKEEMVAKWCFDHGQPAGLGTNTLPSAKATYYPLRGTQAVFGALAFKPRDEKEELSTEEKSTVETFAHLLASALDRVLASRSAEESRLSNEAEKLKNTFLSSMSHDLRTPLAAIRGSAETLLNVGPTLVEEKRNGLFQTIYSEADRLSRIVNNLLDLTRFETGRLTLNAQTYYLPELIGAAIHNCGKTLEKVKMQTVIPDQLPPMRVDGLLFEQLLQNLLENAARYSPPNSTITLRFEPHAEGWILSVADQGVGVPMGFEHKIFDKFFTMQLRDHPKGAGLGLAICQAIVQLHGGRIWAESSLEGGGLFKILLPSALIVAGDGLPEAAES